MRFVTSEKGIEFIKSYEALVLKAYDDRTGAWTIGYGHTGNVKKGDTLASETEAMALLKKDLKQYAGYVNQRIANKKISFSLNQNQFDALTSFTYNLGPGCLDTLVNGRNAKTVASKMLLYNKAGGRVLEGLKRRRKAEQQLFLKKG